MWREVDQTSANFIWRNCHGFGLNCISLQLVLFSRFQTIWERIVASFCQSCWCCICLHTFLCNSIHNKTILLSFFFQFLFIVTKKTLSLQCNFSFHFSLRTLISLFLNCGMSLNKSLLWVQVKWIPPSQKSQWGHCMSWYHPSMKTWDWRGKPPAFISTCQSF